MLSFFLISFFVIKHSFEALHRTTGDNNNGTTTNMRHEDEGMTAPT